MSKQESQGPFARSAEEHAHRRPLRIALTGGPGGGKTTAADMFRREIGEDVVIVPEAATMLFSGGFPRVDRSEALRATQLAIYHVQCSLEDVQSARFPERILLCDRGTIDSAAYWPDEAPSFFAYIGSSLEQELARYDAVVFFETAAAGGISIEGGNPTRTEGLVQARALDRRLRSLWSQHENFSLVPHNTSFFKKLTHGLETIESLVNRLRYPSPSEEA